MATHDNDAMEPLRDRIKKVRTLIDGLKGPQQETLKNIFLEVCKGETFSVDPNALELLVSLPVESKKEILKVAKHTQNDPEKREEVFEALGFNADRPQEVPLLDNEKIRMYYSALQSGQKENQRIRLMVVGMYGVGKTTLVNNLVDRNVDAQTQDAEGQPIVSTEGIEVHLCEIDQRSKWKTLKPNMKKKTLRTELKKITEEHEEQYNLPIPKYEIVPRLAENNEQREQTKPRSMDTEQASVQPGHLNKGQEKLKAELEAEQAEETPQSQPSIATSSSYLSAEVIQEHVEPECQNENKPFVSIWDFAGQNLYYSTHHFFLNKRSIYLLLMDVTRRLESPINESASQSGIIHKDFTCLDAFKFWINSIHMYSQIYDQETEIKPTIILIGTHKDKMNPDLTEKAKRSEMIEFFNEALLPFRDNEEILKHINEKKFLINNCDKNDPEYEDVRKEVRRLAEGQSYWTEKHPVKYIQLEKEFDKVRASGKEIVTFDEIQQMNSQIPVPLENDEAIRVFLEVQHLFGNILYFDTNELNNHVILSPQWIIEAFKCVINHKKDIPHVLLKQWDEYKKCAKLRKELLSNMFAAKQVTLDCGLEVVINYMEHLNVMAKPVCPEDFPEDEDCTANDHKPKLHDFYIVPCQLPAKADCDIEKLTNPERGFKTQALCFVFKDHFMPPATFHRLLVACMKYWEIAKTKDSKNNSQMMLYNGFGAFKTCSNSQLRLWYCDHIIYARMIFQENIYNDERDIDTEKCQQCRRILYGNLMAILGLLPRSKNLKKTTPYEEYIQCPHLTKHNEGLFRVNDFLVDKRFTCEDDHTDEEKHVLYKHDVLKYWYKDHLDAIEDRRDREFDGVPTDKGLRKIAQHLVKMEEIWLLGIELGVTNVTLERMHQDHWKDGRNVLIFKMLIEWRNNKSEKLPELRKAIRAVQKNHERVFFEIYNCIDNPAEDLLTATQ